jgi:hypothetical protein
MCRPVRTLLLALSAVSVATSARNVTISKCCKFDESLSSTENKCLPVVHQPTWTLKVYSPAKQAYLPKDRVPPNWHLKAGVKPDCFRPALLTPHLGTYVPFQNGSLFVVEYNKLVHPGNYCIDYGAVLACLEDQPQSMSLVRVKKCCGSDGIFSETNNTCIHMRDSPYRIDLGPNKTLGTGFPSCSQQEIVFVGKLDEARMQDNGSLWLTKTKTLIPVGNYCLEHVFENAGELHTFRLGHVMTPFCHFMPIPNSSVASPNAIKALHDKIYSTKTRKLHTLILKITLKCHLYQP